MSIFSENRASRNKKYEHILIDMASRKLADEKYEQDPATWTAFEEKIFILLMDPLPQLQQASKSTGFSYDAVLNALIAPEEVWLSCIKEISEERIPMLQRIRSHIINQRDSYPPRIQYPYEDEKKKMDMEAASTNDTPSALPNDNSDGGDYLSTSMLKR
ncbi:hypothetical protein AKJ16_DCAP07354 [Drosera capensis]